MPAHGPLIAAIIGLGTLSVNVCGVCSNCSGAAPSRPSPDTSPDRSPCVSPSVCSDFMSAPAQKPRPAPVTTIARTSAEAAHSRSSPK